MEKEQPFAAPAGATALVDLEKIQRVTEFSLLNLRVSWRPDFGQHGGRKKWVEEAEGGAPLFPRAFVAGGVQAF